MFSRQRGSPGAKVLQLCDCGPPPSPSGQDSVLSFPMNPVQDPTAGLRCPPCEQVVQTRKTRTAPSPGEGGVCSFCSAPISSFQLPEASEGSPSFRRLRSNRRRSEQSPWHSSEGKNRGTALEQMMAPRTLMPSTEPVPVNSIHPPGGKASTTITLHLQSRELRHREVR